MKCSFYQNASDNTGQPVPLSAILHGIKNGKWKDQVLVIRNSEKEVADELKKKLPAATFSGTFFPKRAKVNVQQYNNLVVIDIDHIEGKVQTIFNALKEDPHVMALWVSPSGTGIKGLVLVTSDKEHHLDAFRCLEMYFETNYAVSLDASGSDECRLCFVSYDPELHINAEAVAMPIEYREEARSVIYKDRDFSKRGLQISADDREKYSVCRKWAEKYRPYAEGRNNHVFLCACNMNRVGIEIERATIFMIHDCADFPVQEIKTTIAKAYKRYASEFATQTIYSFEQEQQSHEGAFIYLGLDDMLDIIEESNEETGISFGDKQVDAVTGGFQNGNLYGFIGPEKTYKTTEAVSLSSRTSEFHGPVLYLSGEMSPRQTLRMFILPYGIDINNKEQYEANKERVRSIISNQLRRVKIVNDSNFTPENVIATSKAMEDHFKEPVRLIVVDGMQNWRKIRGSEHEQDSNSSREMKDVAKAINCPVIVILHTRNDCKPWYRQPSAYLRSGINVRRNLDAYFDFSRFIEDNGKYQNSQGKEYDLRKDFFLIAVRDQRNSGESVERVFSISGLNPIPLPERTASEFEIIVETNDGYSR